MRSRWWLAPIGTGLMLAVAVGGCRGGGEEAGGDKDQALLEQVMLTADDLPSGLQRVSATFSTNEEAVEEASDPAGELSKLESWGRRLGYRVTFLRGPDVSPGVPARGIDAEANLYDTAQGAGDSLAEKVSAARAVDWTLAYPTLIDVEASEIEGSGIGEEVYWVRVTGFESPDGTTLVVDDEMVFRVGRVRAFLRVEAGFPGATDRTVNSNQVEGWARLFSERIADVLAADAVP